MKKEIKPVTGALGKVTDLRGVSFLWKDPQDKPMEDVQYGLIAQEVAKVLPGLVNEKDDKMKTLSVNYSGLFPYLIEAIKELKVVNDNQQAQIETLRAERDIFKAKFEQLRAANDNIRARLDAIEGVRKARLH